MPPLKPASLLRKSPRHIQSHFRPCYRCQSTSTSNPPPPPPTAYAPLPTRRLISLHGRDASHFLQGLTTQNISSSISTPGFYSAFLNASGRVLHDVFIYPAAHSRDYREVVFGGRDEGHAGFLIEVDANEVDSLARHLKRFKLRAKVGITVLEEGEWGVWQRWGEGEERAASEIGCSDNRAPDMGYRMVVPANKRPEGEGEVKVECYNLRRIMMGVAEGQSEILKETALPQESNIDYMGGIDFRKGCYIGQELTIRTHHTGVVRKRILPVQIYDTGGSSNPPEELAYNPDSTLVPPPRGSSLSRADAKGRSAGKWLGWVGNVGLALCRLEVMTDTVLTGEGSQWKPEHEFKVAWEQEEGGEGGEVRIKAFVPSWHRGRAEAQKPHRN